MSEGETPTPSSLTEAACLSPVEVQSLINECNHQHQENGHLLDLVCWLRMQLEGLSPHQAGVSTSLLILEPHADFFARKQMEDAWDIVIQQSIGEANAEV